MKNRLFLDKMLCCPICKNNLIKDSKSRYYCDSHGKFQVICGIPSFLESHTNEFDSHWKDNASDSIPESKLNAAEHFLKPLFINSKNKTKWLCLDAGCGDGVHLEAISSRLPEVNVIGIDISMEALKLTQSRCPKTSTLINGDLCKLPFIQNLFDCVFSFGVLAYTENPSKAFQELCRVVSPGGLIGIWIATRQHGFLEKLFYLTRRFSQIIGPFMTARLADLLVPFLGILPTASKASLLNATWKQCREIILVNIAPQRLYFPEISEVEKWFKDNNINVIWRDPERLTLIWGEKIL